MRKMRKKQAEEESRYQYVYTYAERLAAENSKMKQRSCCHHLVSYKTVGEERVMWLWEGSQVATEEEAAGLD